MSCYSQCSVALPQGAVGGSVVCNCGIARPLGLHYNHYSKSVNESVRGQEVKMLIALEPHCIF